MLETANIKLTSVVSDVWGKSGQSMINAIIQGESDAQARSRMSARNGCRGKLPQLQAALEGWIQPHHQMLLQRIFAHLRFLESSMRACSQGDRSADGTLSRGGGALDDTSRCASSGGDGLCFGGGD